MSRCSACHRELFEIAQETGATVVDVHLGFAMRCAGCIHTAAERREVCELCGLPWFDHEPDMCGAPACPSGATPGEGEGGGRG